MFINFFKYECLLCCNFCSYLEKVIIFKNVNCQEGGVGEVIGMESLYRGSIKTSYMI